MVGVRIAFRLEPVSLRPIVCKGRGLQKTDEELNKTGQTSELMTISSVPAISSMQSHFGEHWHLRPPVRSRGERGNPECGHRRCYELNLVEQPKPVPEVSFWLARWQSVPTNSRLWEAGSHEFRQPGVELSFGLLRKLESHLSGRQTCRAASALPEPPGHHRFGWKPGRRLSNIARPAWSLRKSEKTVQLELGRWRVTRGASTCAES